DEALSDILERPNIKKTTLTEWFIANNDPTYRHLARKLTYPNFPTKFIWNSKLKKWQLRKKGGSIGRIYFVQPTAGEKYFLRMLLNIRKGITSFEHLRTVNNITYNTFKETCDAL
ncbi:4385_t:CDS:1, partial [Cetraspora pellucida]